MVQCTTVLHDIFNALIQFQLKGKSNCSSPTLNQKNVMIKKYLISIVAVLFAIYVHGQECNSASFVNAYIPSDGFISIFANHSFNEGGSGMFPGLIGTARGANPGFVNFTQSGSWSSATDVAHVNGYVRTFSSDAFAFPVGDGSSLRMIGVSGSANAAASYVNEDPSLLTGVMTIANPDLEAVSVREYWTLSGSNATSITMTWDQLSNVEDLTNGDINKLTVVGWNGSGWDIIPTAVNSFMIQANSQNIFNENITTSFNIGSMTTNTDVNLDDYVLFTLGSLLVPRSSALEDGDINVSPNPARLGAPTFVSYDLVGKAGKMEIYDGFNRLVYTQTLDQESGTIRLPELNLSDDRYVVTLIEQNGAKTSKILIVVK